MAARSPERESRRSGSVPEAGAPSSALTQCGADHQGQQRPHGCAAPRSRPPVLTAGREAAGPARRVECPRERAGAAAAALGPASGGRGGAAPPLRLPPGAQPRGPASGHPRRAGGGRCSDSCTGAHRRTHPPSAPTPARLRLGRARARTAVSCALQRRRWRPREGAGRTGRGRDESPRGEGAAAQPLPQRPGRRPLRAGSPGGAGIVVSGCPCPSSRLRRLRPSFGVGDRSSQSHRRTWKGGLGRRDGDFKWRSEFVGDAPGISKRSLPRIPDAGDRRSPGRHPRVQTLTEAGGRPGVQSR